MCRGLCAQRSVCIILSFEGEYELKSCSRQKEYSVLGTEVLYSENYSSSWRLE